MIAGIATKKENWAENPNKRSKENISQDGAKCLYIYLRKKREKIIQYPIIPFSETWGTDSNKPEISMGGN